MDILEHFDNLRHQNDLLNNFFQHYWDLNNPVLSDNHWISLPIHYLSHCLQGLLDETYFRLEDLFLLPDQFSLNLKVYCLQVRARLLWPRNILLVHFFYDFNFSQEMRNLNKPLHDLFNILVDVDDFGNNPFDDFNGGRSEDDLGFLFILIDFGDFLDDWHKLFDIVRNLFDLVYRSIDGHYLFLKPLHLLDLTLNIWLGNLLKLILLLNVNSLLDLRNYLRLSLLDKLFNYFFDYLSHRLYFDSLGVDVDWDCFLDFDRYWDFNGFVENSIDKLYLPLLDWDRNYFVDVHGNWNFMFLYHYSFLSDFLDLNISAYL